MNRYKLLTLSTGKQGSGLFWLGLLLLAIAAVDHYYRPFLGPLTTVAWVLGGLAILLAILLRIPLWTRTGTIQVGPDGLTVRYGRREVWLGYEEIGVVTGGRISQHHSLHELPRRHRQAVKPYFNQTHIFIALHEGSEAVEEAQRKLPRFMLGTTQPGLLLLIQDEWLVVDRAIDAARITWLGQIKQSHQEEHRSLVAQLWAEDGDEELEEEPDDDILSPL
jgi:hypothetical protein